jgi:hypothetical protein
MEHAPAQPEQFEVFIDALAEVDELVGEYLRLCFLTEENRVTDKEARTEAWRQLRALRAQHEVEWFGVKPKEDAWRWGIPRRLILPAKPEVLARVRSSPLGRFVSALRLEGPVEPGTLDALKGHHALRSLELLGVAAGLFPGVEHREAFDLQRQRVIEPHHMVVGRQRQRHPRVRLELERVPGPQHVADLRREGGPGGDDAHRAGPQRDLRERHLHRLARARFHLQRQAGQHQHQSPHAVER